MAEQEVTTLNIRTPSKILHFSDGELEVFDDDDINLDTKEEIAVDEKSLSWTPWFFYKAQRFGQNIISGLDYTGEKLADFLNITSPKYAYEIRQYQKEIAKKAAEAEIEKQNTWTIEPSPVDSNPITTPPTQSTDLKF